MNRDAAVGTTSSRLHVDIPVGPGLAGDLTVPGRASGVTLFAHGSGSSRFSPRNRLVADELNRRGVATLLFDLLSPDEEAYRANVFDVGLLAGRLEETTRWLLKQPAASGLAPCYFGASTGAAAALAAAAQLGSVVRAVVSRGGRPDLAGTRAAAGRLSHAPDRRGRRRHRARAQPPGARRAHMRAKACDHPRREPSVRGAGDARARCRARRRLARRPSRGAPCAGSRAQRGRVRRPGLHAVNPGPTLDEDRRP